MDRVVPLRGPIFRLNYNPMRQFLLLLSILLFACTAPGQGSGSLDAAGFDARLTEQGAQLLDVRTAGEFQGGHLADARNFDWTNGELEAIAPKLDKSKPVLLYCASGRRSAAARDFLVKQGFTDVVDLSGGIGAWTSAGRPVVK